MLALCFTQTHWAHISECQATLLPQATLSFYRQNPSRKSTGVHLLSNKHNNHQFQYHKVRLTNTALTNIHPHYWRSQEKQAQVNNFVQPVWGKHRIRHRDPHSHKPEHPVSSYQCCIKGGLWNLHWDPHQ